MTDEELKAAETAVGELWGPSSIRELVYKLINEVRRLQAVIQFAEGCDLGWCNRYDLKPGEKCPHCEMRLAAGKELED